MLSNGLFYNSAIEYTIQKVHRNVEGLKLKQVLARVQTDINLLVEEYKCQKELCQNSFAS
jgi:hypothetical protein